MPNIFSNTLQPLLSISGTAGSTKYSLQLSLPRSLFVLLMIGVLELLGMAHLVADVLRAAFGYVA